MQLEVSIDVVFPVYKFVGIQAYKLSRSFALSQILDYHTETETDRAK